MLEIIGFVVCLTTSAVLIYFSAAVFCILVKFGLASKTERLFTLGIFVVGCVALYLTTSILPNQQP